MGMLADGDVLATQMLSLEGEVDIYERDRLYSALESFEDADLAIIDLAKVTYFDLTLINGLVRLRNRMLVQKGASRIYLVGASSLLKRVLEITELLAIFHLPDSSSLIRCELDARDCRADATRLVEPIEIMMSNISPVT